MLSWFSSQNEEFKSSQLPLVQAFPASGIVGLCRGFYEKGFLSANSLYLHYLSNPLYTISWSKAFQDTSCMMEEQWRHSFIIMRYSWSQEKGSFSVHSFKEHFTPVFFNVKHILYEIVTCTLHIKIYNIRVSKVLQGVLMQ